ncbi:MULTISPECIES: sugar ABC transporter substrate-binding protein [Streptomyces]|uniref:Sugar ABC transporter substrate-binding protein n=1 Tax=Streptomyces doudnae TaxID=3075536 RepID=A0ABD5EMJ3_9ACTN|nr:MULTISPECIES: sugar ABC transporter substrate-binding protein [unclassified Streptomyces]MDT0435513.1 sugar ABC transporter substrate-binding protein [Streptomyces sp. DSM 41981]MYQ64315.1 extracellular solute-binding protein [Streptomyces sp. SID4950]SCD76346.1 carbohydrate ABC transporter substrate-binding protein, CUT1 family [Streptomyces sp. SolWspMP-5a-2]
MNRAAAIGSLALTLASALTLTACGGSGGAGVAADAEQTLTVWAMGTEGEKLADVAKAYEKSHANITVKVTPIGWDVAHQKLVAAAAAGKLPDVVQMGGSYLGEFADMGVLEPVDTKTFAEDDFFPAAWQQGSYDGKVYGVPWYVDTRVLFYRTDLAKKAGIDKAPATMADLQSDAAAYRAKAGTKWGLSIQPGGLDTVQSFYPFLYSAGGAIIDQDGKAAVNSAAAVKALENYGSYFTKNLSEKSVRPGYDVTKDFNTGAVPMFFGGPWLTNLLDENYPGLKGKWAVAPVPADQASVSMAGGSSLAISADSDHKAAAKAFIASLTDAKGQSDWFERTNDLPANTAAWKSGTLATDPTMKIWRAQMDTAKATPAQPKLTEITSKVDTAIESVTQGKSTAKAALDKAQSEIEGLVQ